MADMLADVQGLGLTPQELNKVLYHRQNLAKPFISPEGYPVTIYATGIEIPEGKHKGKFASVPGYVDGKILDDEDALWSRWKKEIDEGIWPIYDSSEALNKRDAWLHQIMEKDMQETMSPLNYESPFYNDPFLDY